MFHEYNLHQIDIKLRLEILLFVYRFQKRSVRRYYLPMCAIRSRRGGMMVQFVQDFITDGSPG